MGITVPAPDHRPINRAFLASAGFHALLALLIPAFVVAGNTGSAIETISFAHVLQVHVAPVRPQATQRRATAVHRAPNLRNAPAPALAQRHTRSADQPRRTDAGGAPAVAAAAQTGSTIAQSQNSAPPIAQSSPVAAPAESPHRSVGGYMPLGAEQPVPVLDPGVRTALVALGAHVTLTIDVDADGHTKSVAFKPELDPALEARIRDLLDAASWDPATCGAGVSCEAVATITL